jgi:hypothetical protein
LDIWDYFTRKEREFGGVPTDRPLEEMMQAAEPPEDNRRGIIEGHLDLSDSAYVDVYERIVIEGDDDPDPRAAYCYTLVMDGMHVHRWENDPRKHPEMPVHEHEGFKEMRREHTDRISLRAVLERAWEEVSLQAEAPLDP